MSWFKRATIALLGVVLIATPTHGNVPQSAGEFQCPNANIFGSTLISGLCWSCMFPVYLAGVRMFGGRFGRPTGANTNRACFCSGDFSAGQMPTIGFSVGMYVPSRIVESVRKPWCFPTLFGADMGDANLMDSSLNFGGRGRNPSERGMQDLSLYTWHFYAFPIMQMLDLFDLPQCNTDNYYSLDIMFMSEAFPNWYDEELAFLIHPEALLFGNPIALAAQVADCGAASVPGGGPLDSVFWSAGCFGSNYPVAGYSKGTSYAQASSVVATRAMYLLSRLGVLRRTIGSDAMCGGQKMPVLRKSQYRMQQIFPVAESSNAEPQSNPAPPDINLANPGEPPTATEPELPAGSTSVQEINIRNVLGGCCHNVGENTLLWGEWRQRPGTGEDFVYVLWRWTDCCAGIFGSGR